MFCFPSTSIEEKNVDKREWKKTLNMKYITSPELEQIAEIINPAAAIPTHIVGIPEAVHNNFTGLRERN